MANIRDRLRCRAQRFLQKVDHIDLTDESAVVVSSKFIECIDLTDRHVKIEPERLADFRQSLFAVFHRRRKQIMSLLRLARCVNLEIKEKFSKMEIHSALSQMTDSNEIFIYNGLVHLV
ncbi:uncharacterized protein LOC119068675 [Bradysia coprophila]|uniref:uncharacterized protein LOC119068675 n=1 Tax=Bradysia coprophila TaxID=38358 RepID=UPI00187DD161|nr:uncharacterized protein LOC119068675 [Bradysia coprophila]